MCCKGVELWRRLRLDLVFQVAHCLSLVDVRALAVENLASFLFSSARVAGVPSAVITEYLDQPFRSHEITASFKTGKGGLCTEGKSPERSRGEDRIRVALSLCMCRVNLRGNINIRAVCSVCYVTCDISPYYNIGELF